MGESGDRVIYFHGPMFFVERIPNHKIARILQLSAATRCEGVVNMLGKQKRGENGSLHNSILVSHAQSLHVDLVPFDDRHLSNELGLLQSTFPLANQPLINKCCD